MGALKGISIAGLPLCIMQAFANSSLAVRSNEADLCDSWILAYLMIQALVEAFPFVEMFTFHLFSSSSSCVLILCYLMCELMLQLLFELQHFGFFALLPVFTTLQETELSLGLSSCVRSACYWTLF